MTNGRMCNCEQCDDDHGYKKSGVRCKGATVSVDALSLEDCVLKSRDIESTLEETQCLSYEVKTVEDVKMANCRAVPFFQ